MSLLLKKILCSIMLMLKVRSLLVAKNVDLKMDHRITLVAS
jgi:hypothetical protein